MNKILEWWIKVGIFNKITILSLFYLFIFIIISLILMLVNNTFIYGALIGASMLIISYFLIWIIWFSNKKNRDNPKLVITFFWVMPLIRTLIFFVSFLLIILVINPSFRNDELNNINNFISPINIFSFLFTYLIPSFAGITILMLDFFYLKDKKYFVNIKDLKKKKNKEGED